MSREKIKANNEQSKANDPNQIKPSHILFVVVFWASVAAFMGLLVWLMNM